MLGILSVNSFVVHDGEEDNMDLIGNKYIIKNLSSSTSHKKTLKL